MASNERIAERLRSIAATLKDKQAASFLRRLATDTVATPPSSIELARNQESWADFVLGKVQASIDDREEELRESGWKDEEFPDDDKLMELYDDEMFWSRYGEEMQKQRTYLKKKYFNE